MNTREYAERITGRAGAVEKVSWFLFAMVVLFLGIAFLEARDGGGLSPVICAGAFFTLGWMTNLIAQLLHLRAGIEWLAMQNRSDKEPVKVSVAATLPVKADEYFLWLDEKPSGPHTEAQIDSMFGQKLIANETACCRNGDKTWITVGQMRAEQASAV